MQLYSHREKAAVDEHTLEVTKEVDLEDNARSHLTVDHSHTYVHVYRKEFLSFSLAENGLLRIRFGNASPFFISR